MQKPPSCGRTRFYAKYFRRLQVPILAPVLDWSPVRFEIAITLLMKMNQEGHHFTLTQLSLSLTLPVSRLELVLLPGGRKALPEIIDMTEQVE